MSGHWVQEQAAALELARDKDILPLPYDETHHWPLMHFKHGTAQVSIYKVAYRDAWYVLNFINSEPSNGDAQVLYHDLLALMDSTRTTLVVHPDNERLERGSLRTGFYYSDEQPTWQDKPFMVREYVNVDMSNRCRSCGQPWLCKCDNPIGPQETQ